MTPKPKIVGELCKCGHKKSEHSHVEVEEMLIAKGHGSCSKCDCQKFTWKRFIYSDE